MRYGRENPSWRKAGAVAIPRVLIIENSRMLRAILVELVVFHGYAPVEAETACDGLASAFSDPPDVIVLDERLPDATGADVVRRLQASSDLQAREIPVIGLVPRIAPAADRFAGGAKCVVRKPVEPEELMRAIRWALAVYGDDGER
jgi:CheY-like chemotaxis protein